MDYLDAIEHATICMRPPRGLFVSIGLMVVYSSSLRSQRRFEAAASELESHLGQRHQPALAYGIAANAPKFVVAFDVPAQPAANEPELTIVGTRTAS